MAILNNNPLVGASGNQGGYNINNSLRFRSSASAYLSRTPVSAGNRRTFTFSAWVKRGILTDDRILYSGTVNGSTQVGGIFFNGGDDNLRIIDYQGSALWNVATTQKFRDPSAWYHIVVAVDTTQATASNRVKMYVNGNQVTAFAVANYPSQNTDTFFNYNAAQALGRYSWSGGGGDFDGYMAEVNFIDGLQKAASDFGETDTTTGVWKPKAYTGTYGTNGFYLKFSDIATTSGSNAGLGKDFSGNSNYWTTNNISVTAGTTYDAMTDSPTNTSATVANYATLLPFFTQTVISGSTAVSTITNGNLTTACSNTTTGSNAIGSFGVSSGKWYFEVTRTSGGANTDGVGFFANAITTEAIYRDDGKFRYAGTETAYGTSWATNGYVVGIALDLDNTTITFYVNGVSQGAAKTNLPAGTYSPYIYNRTTGTLDVNFGQRPFSYTPPTGFVALNTYNLPTSTILQGNKYMDATLYTGTGSSLNVTGVNFQPDFVWIKERVGAADHGLYDAVRGVQKQLESNTTDAETTETTGLTAFNSNGFTVGALAQLNTNTDTYVGWSWKANGAGSSNTNGSITSTVSVNTTAGFSVVTYTGNATNGATVGHGLGVAPKMIIGKIRSTTGDWYVWQTAMGDNFMRLNTTAAQVASTANGVYNTASFSSTVFALGSGSSMNASGATFVAYCWAEISGFSAFGSYEGNASSDGPMIYLGFRPKFVLIKRSSVAGNDWVIRDSSRDTYNTTNLNLYANLSDAEASGSVNIDFLSNGFKLRGSGVGANGSGTYIYAAFAEHPFKNANAR